MTSIHAVRDEFAEKSMKRGLGEGRNTELIAWK